MFLCFHVPFFVLYITWSFLELSHHFMDYWTQFAATGNPNGVPGSPKVWPEYTAAADQNLQLDLDISVDTVSVCVCLFVCVVVCCFCVVLCWFVLAVVFEFHTLMCFVPLCCVCNNDDDNDDDDDT